MITFRTIDEHNYQECFKLKVHPAQDTFVASNIYSLAEAWVLSTAKPFAIYADDTMVGFVMFGVGESPEVVWILRLMIGAAFQRQGFGREAMQHILYNIREELHGKSAALCCEPENQVAERLYRSFGFLPTGEMMGEEIVMRMCFEEVSGT